jgi:hypothetical protein
MVTRSLSLESDSLPSSFRALIAPLSAAKAAKNVVNNIPGPKPPVNPLNGASLPGRSSVERSKGTVTVADVDDDVDAVEARREADIVKEKRSKLRAARSVILSAAEVTGASDDRGRVAAAGEKHAQVEGTTSSRGDKGWMGTTGEKLLSMNSELLNSLRGARGKETVPTGHVKPKVRVEVVRDMDQEIVQTVDIPLVPLLVAPPIEDRADTVTPVTFIPAADVYSIPPVSPNSESNSKKRKRDNYSVEEFSYDEFDPNEVSHIGSLQSPVSGAGDIEGLGLVLEGSIEEVEYSKITYDEKSGKVKRVEDPVVHIPSEEPTKEGSKYFLSPDDPPAQSDPTVSGLRFASNQGSRSSVPMSVTTMSAADEMANELTALKNDLGDLDDAHVSRYPLLSYPPLAQLTLLLLVDVCTDMIVRFKSYRPIAI